MWHFISEQISEQIGKDFICDDIRQGYQGDSHQSYKISDGRLRFFVKINDRLQLPNFEAEAEGLEHICASGMFRTPQVICSGRVAEHSFLVLEHLNMHTGDTSCWHMFGQQLARMHQQQSQQMYGWQEDNFIGTSRQSNQWSKKWHLFFAEQRIGAQLQMLAETDTKLANIDQVVTSVAAVLAGHQPNASLLHGDLWQGNTGFYQQQPVLFDPAFYFGDRETDIAMTEMFNRFPASFYQGYNDIWPLPDGYEYRKSVYQLYHLLNHALMFGGHYLDASQAMLKNLDN